MADPSGVRLPLPPEPTALGLWYRPDGCQPWSPKRAAPPGRDGVSRRLSASVTEDREPMGASEHSQTDRGQRQQDRPSHGFCFVRPQLGRGRIVAWCAGTICVFGVDLP